MVDHGRIGGRTSNVEGRNDSMTERSITVPCKLCSVAGGLVFVTNVDEEYHT